VTARTFALQEAHHVLQLIKDSKLDGAAVLAPE
jgi:hypothetical protein